MEAYTGDKLQVKVEVNVRVIDPTELPETGDDSVPVGYAFAALALMSTAAGAIVIKRRRSTEAA